ncbi:MAG: succinate dehydrogenase, hydrophobic membrane anchor protein, partial [Betaproteobacteria bacterium]
MEQNFGSKRTVVGAHYGLRDWLSQRITAAVMALFTIVLLLQVLFGAE